jgi:hypothetical protein
LFAGLFKRAEASVDNAIGELGNRVLIAIPFIAATGFLAASLWLLAERTYGAEIGNLVVAGGFFLLGCLIALTVKMRRQNRPMEAEAEPEPLAGTEAPTTTGRSIFEDENLMGIVSAAAPIVLPAVLRTASKNWPLVLAAAAGLYVFSRSETSNAASPPSSAQM